MRRRRRRTAGRRRLAARVHDARRLRGRRRGRRGRALLRDHRRHRPARPRGREVGVHAAVRLSDGHPVRLRDDRDGARVRGAGRLRRAGVPEVLPVHGLALVLRERTARPARRVHVAAPAALAAAADLDASLVLRDEDVLAERSDELVGFELLTPIARLGRRRENLDDHRGIGDRLAERLALLLDDVRVESTAHDARVGLSVERRGFDPDVGFRVEDRAVGAEQRRERRDDLRRQPRVLRAPSAHRVDQPGAPLEPRPGLGVHLQEVFERNVRAVRGHADEQSVAPLDRARNRPMLLRASTAQGWPWLGCARPSRRASESHRRRPAVTMPTSKLESHRSPTTPLGDRSPRGLLTLAPTA